MNFNESLTNHLISFEQLGPVHYSTVSDITWFENGPQDVLSTQKCIDYMQKMSIYGHFCCYTNPTFIHDCHLISRLTLVMLNKMPCPLLIFVQSVCMIQVVDTTSNTEWQTVQIQISWLLQKPTDLDLHCLQRQSISGFSRTRVKGKSWLFIKAGLAQLIVFLETDPRRRLCFSSSSFG